MHLLLTGVRGFRGDKLGVLEARAHQWLVQCAFGHGHHDAGLVNVTPTADFAVAARGNGHDIAGQIRLGEAQHLLALGGDTDGKHGHVATLLQQVGGQAGKRAVHELHAHPPILSQGLG